MKRKNLLQIFLRKRNFSIDKWDVYPNDPNVVGVKKRGKKVTHIKVLLLMDIWM